MKSKALLFLVLTFIFINSCNKEEELEQETPLVGVFDVSNETPWDYWVVGFEGDYLFVNVQNDKPTEVFFKPYTYHEGYLILFDDNGYPKKLIIEDYVFIFSNYSGKYVDIALVEPDGTIQIARQVESDFNWDADLLKSTEAFSDWLRWTGHAAGAAACITGLVAAPATFGASLVLTYIGCGATVVSIAAEFLPDDYEILGLSATTVGSFATAAGCASPGGAVSCVLGSASTVATATAAYVEDVEENNQVQVAESALNYGYGDIQITLTWDNEADLDLHVIDPDGHEIDWSNSTSPSGGVLDIDDLNGYGPENIYWDENTAPNGTYSVYVNYYSGLQTSNYTILINAFGNTESYSGTITMDQTIQITSFDQSSFKSGNLKSMYSITKNEK